MVHIGIDWGTQSSKSYIFDEGSGGPVLGPIIESALHHDTQQDMIFFSKAKIPMEEITQPGRFEKSYPIKRQMIDNPNVSLWEGVMDDTNLTLGASIVFSLVAILRSAIAAAAIIDRTVIKEICFSFPNWSPSLDTGHDRSFRKFRQAARVAIQIATDGRYDHIDPQSGVHIPTFSGVVNALRTAWEPNPLTIDKVTQLSDTLDIGISVNYLPESMASGFPYLLKLQSGHEYAFRLLVVDVGAGSTDIGYMIQNRKGPKDPFYIVYFKPAPALNIAGIAITNNVSRVFGINSEEAEDRKIELSTTNRLSQAIPYVAQEWIPAIANTARDYVASLRHHVLMDKREPVNVILTGGSSAVPGLLEEVLVKVEQGLGANPKKGSNSPRVALTARHANIAILPGIDVFETGRRSVSVGAGQPNKSRMIFE